jgi:hypothetical protein
LPAPQPKNPPLQFGKTGPEGKEGPQRASVILPAIKEIFAHSLAEAPGSIWAGGKSAKPIGGKAPPPGSIAPGRPPAGVGCQIMPASISACDGIELCAFAFIELPRRNR